MAEDKKVMLNMYDNVLGALYPKNEDDELIAEPYLDLVYTKDIIDSNIEIFKYNENNYVEWRCEYCDVNVNYNDMEDHMNSRVHNFNSSSKKYIFNILFDVRGDFNKLSITEIMEMKKRIDETIKYKKNGSDEFICYYCHKLYKKKYLSKHVKTKKHKENFNKDLEDFLKGDSTDDE